MHFSLAGPRGTKWLGLVVALCAIGGATLLSVVAAWPQQNKATRSPDRPSEPPNRQEQLARDAYEEGLRLYGRGADSADADAIQYFEQSLSLFEETLGPRHIRTLLVLNTLAKAHAGLRHGAEAREYLKLLIERAGADGQARTDITRMALAELGRLQLQAYSNEEAESNLAKALDLTRPSAKEGDLDTARLLLDLAIAQVRLKRRDDAHLTLTNAWTTYSSASDTDPTLAIDILGSLSLSYVHRGDPVNALSLLDKQLALCESTSAPGRTKASTLHLLGVAYESLGDFDAARNHLVRAVAVAEELTGADSILSLRTIGSLAVLEMNSGNFQQAECHAKRYLKLLQATENAPATEIAVAQCTVAAALISLGKYDEARLHVNRALHTPTNDVSQFSRLPRLALRAAGSLEMHCGNYEKAIEHLGKAASICRENYGSSSSEFSRSLEILARAQITFGQLSAAGETLDEALALGCANPETRELDMAHLQLRRGLVFVRTGNHPSAETMLCAAKRILKSKLPADHYTFGDLLIALGQLHLQRGELDRAENDFEQAIKIRKSRFGEEHDETAEAFDFLGQLFLARRNLAQAERWLEQARRIREACLGARHPATAESLYHLGQLAVDRGSL